MLPAFLSGTYKQYKDDTDSIATWLVQTANRCDFTSDLVSNNEPAKKSSKSKGKSKKETRDANRRVPANKRQNKILIKEFLLLAKHIASCSKSPINVPLRFLNTVSRVIAARKKSNEYFKTLEQRNLGASDGHQHFIGVLEEVYNLLKPLCISAVAAESSTISPAHDLRADLATGIAGLSNHFHTLPVEEPSDELLNSPDVSSGLKSDSTIKYEAEPMEGQQKLYFASFSLFEDVNMILEYLRDLWTRYREDNVDLITASISSNTAIDMVRRLEQDLVAEFPAAADTKSFLNMIYIAHCAAEGRPQPAQGLLERIPVLDLRMYDTAQWLLVPTMTLLSAFAAIVQPDAIPISKPGHFGIYDSHSDRTKKTNTQKFLEDRTILCEILPDFCFLSKTKTSLPAEDELTRGLREMMLRGNFSLWTVFAAQVFLDIHHVLRTEITSGFVQLQKLGVLAKATTSQTLTFRDGLRVDGWPKQNDQALHQNLIHKIDEYVLKDPIQDLMMEIIKQPPLPEAKFRLYKQHPLLCGLFAFSIQLQLQECGIIYVNAWGSAMNTAHLYNAVRQESVCVNVWPDMELLIQQHTPKKLFVGGAPTKTEDYLKRFCLTVGYDASQYASGRRNQGLVVSKRGPRALSNVSPVSQIFKRRYCDNATTHDLSLEDVETLLNNRFEVEDATSAELDPINIGAHTTSGDTTRTVTVAVKMRSKASARAAMHKHFKKAKRLTPLEFLLALEISISNEVPELFFDYFAFHRACWTLLRNIQQRIHPQLLKYYGPEYLESESQLPIIVGYIFMTGTQSQEAARQMGMLRRGDGVEFASMILQETGQVFEELLEGEKGQDFGSEQLQIISDRGRTFTEKSSLQHLVERARAMGLGDFQVVPEAERP